MIHLTRVFIDLRAFEDNIRFFKSLLSPSCRLCAVVKADAYGHGVQSISCAAFRAGADVLAIVDNWEAEAVRAHHPTCPVIRLRPTTYEEAEEARQWRVEECVGSLPSAEFLSQLGERRQQKIPVHLKLDVGIGRMGFSYPLQREMIRRACELPGIMIKGVMTHFPCADEESERITLEQQERFESQIQAISEWLPPSIVYHAANSAACLRFPPSWKSMVRVGIASYGMTPSEHVALPPRIQPVMSWQTTVVQVRDVPKGAGIGYGMTYILDRERRIATLPIGYADGYLRDFSNNADVLIRGIRCPVIGRISMDMTTVDVTHLPSIAIGDKVTLLGAQGNDTIFAEELARRANTINYEISCLIGKCNRNRLVITDG
ncbi:MAG: alanine racemase [Candidatus Omnitrophota bacterium]|jgi:alanine racemase|nr:MAG: alanine racemase [Candidatus Omnitrophota bacterium]